MKRRSLTVLLCLLAIISLASVGFASWVISAGDTEEATGNIQVEEVSDQRLDIVDVKINGGDPDKANFVFGAEDGKTLTWLKNDTIEDLDLILTFKVVYKGSTTEVKDAEITIALAAEKNTEFKNWIVVAEDSATTATYDDKNGVYTCTLKLAWGSAWDGNNPFTYYNGKDVNGVVEEGREQTWGDHANTQLSAMYEDLKTAKYTVTITANPKATATPEPGNE